MWKQFGVVMLLVLWQQPVKGCHIYENEGHDIRRKRQVSTEATQTKVLRKYFSDCLQNTAGAIYDWKSVVATSVLDTFWYEGNDVNACSFENGRDTAPCWISRLPAYLQSDSQLVEDTSRCINQYAFDVSEGRSEFQGIRLIDEPKTRRKRQTSETEEFSLLSPNVMKYIACVEEQVQLPSNREDLDFTSLVDFVQSSTTCSPELSGCGNDGREILSLGADVPSWPYRFQALIKQTSPIITGIARCNDWVFPLSSSTYQPSTTNSPADPITTPLSTSTSNFTTTPISNSTTAPTSAPTTAPTLAPTTTPLTNLTTTPILASSPSTPSPGEECARLDLVVVFDSSSSIGVRNFRREKMFVKNLLSGIPVGLNQIKVAGVRFDGNPKYIWNFFNSSTSDALMPKINDLMYHGYGTRIMRALWKIRKESFVPAGGDRRNAPNMVILMTDGQTSDDLVYRAPRFRRAARARLVVIPVNNYNTGKINSLVSPPSDENVYFIEETEALKSMIMKIATDACLEQ